MGTVPAASDLAQMGVARRMLLCQRHCALDCGAVSSRFPFAVASACFTFIRPGQGALVDGQVDASSDDLRCLLARLLSVMQSPSSDRPDDGLLGPEWLANEARALVSGS